MDDHRLPALFDDYFDRDLTAAGKAELEQLLLEYPNARAAFWERAGREALLHEWGEEHWGREGLKLLPPPPSRPRVRWLAAGLAAAACLAAAPILLRPQPPAARPLPAAQVEATRAAMLRYARETRWAPDAPDLVPGDTLPRTPLHLRGGLATIELPSGTQVSIEGPARWLVTGMNSVRLEFGRATAFVPDGAHGFRLETPAGALVDYGTIFGVNVERGGGIEAHVFEGKVELQPERGGAVTGPRPVTAGTAVTVDPGAGTVLESVADRRAFPTPARQLGEALFGGGFEPGLRLSRGGMPTRAGEWCGDWCEVVPAQDGVSPRAGQLMLRFKRADSVPSAAPSTRRASELWQTIDLRALRKRLGATGPLLAEAQAFFNTGLSAQDGTPRRFAVKLVAWHGAMRNVKRAWTQSLTAPEAVVGTAETSFTIDQDPATWEPLEATLILPPEADEVVFAVTSLAPSPKSRGEDFPSNFADSVSLTISAPPQPAIAGKR